MFITIGLIIFAIIIWSAVFYQMYRRYMMKKTLEYMINMTREQFRKAAEESKEISISPEVEKKIEDGVNKALTPFYKELEDLKKEFESQTESRYAKIESTIQKIRSLD